VEQASEIPLAVYPSLAKARTFLEPLLARLAIDRAVMFGVCAKLWQATASLITVAVIAICYTPQAQGYYYMFLNLMALQVFAELGLGNVVVNFASHEWAKLRLGEGKRITGSEEALGRLISLGRFAFRWYVVAGTAVFLVVGTVGWLFFASSPDITIHWKLPWVVFCLLIAVRLWGIPFIALLEGCNQVCDVYLCRLVDAVATSVTLWLCIVLDFGLFAVCLSTLAGVFWCAVFLFCRYRRFFGQFLRRPRVGIGWRTEILPMQWRIALSFLGGYFTFYLFTPLTFKFEGPAAAGRMGMTFAVASGLSTVASMWIYTRVPRFGVMIAGRQFQELDQLFRRLLFMSTALLFVGGLFAWSLAYLLQDQHPFLSTRMLFPLPMGLLFLATLFMQVSMCEAAYLRAHKKEPFLILSIVQGLLTCLSSWVLGRHYGALGMVAGYLAVVAFFTLPYGTYVWSRCRNEWHHDNKQA
jgi:hypothetical protein